ncbi:hypothetical protein C8R48DRAFT_680467 [Suillus tomentosus]|nr:hypothetical protein C8R48DRAFT_680467 [Suillus tomentosus]
MTECSLVTQPNSGLNPATHDASMEEIISSVTYPPSGVIPQPLLLGNAPLDLCVRGFLGGLKGFAIRHLSVLVIGRERTCIISRMIRASGPWAHDKNILDYDRWAGRQIIPDGDGWAEVVGYYADGCIKGWAQTHIKLDGWAEDRWAEGVVWDVVLDGWAEGGIKYRWVVLQNVESGVRSLCCPTRSQVPTTRIGVNCTEFRDPELNT